MAEYLKPEYVFSLIKVTYWTADRHRMADRAVGVLKTLGYSIAPVTGMPKSHLCIVHRIPGTPEAEAWRECNFIIAMGYISTKEEVSCVCATTTFQNTITILQEIHLDLWTSGGSSDEPLSDEDDSGYAPGASGCVRKLTQQDSIERDSTV